MTNETTRSKHRPNLPRRKFFIADAGQFAFGLLATSYRDDAFKDAHPNLLHGFSAVEDGSGIDIHVLLHPVVERGISRHFDTRSGFATIDTAASGGEHCNIAA